MSSIDNTLNERGARYGAFGDNAAITQRLKHVMRQYPGWGYLSLSQAEALEMIVHKIGRILNGDPNYIDSWHDIGGYAGLVERGLRREQDAGEPVGPEQDAEGPVGPKQPPQAAERVAETLSAFVSQFIREDSAPPATARAQLSILAELRAMFPTADITVTFESEESGLTD